MYETCLRGHVPDSSDLMSKNDIVRLKRCIYAQGASILPPITTHNIINDATDPIMCALRRCQLFNNRYDRVKVIFHPEFLSSTNPLFGLEYQDFVRGCHMGVFPSYYEPWYFFYNLLSKLFELKRMGHFTIHFVKCLPTILSFQTAFLTTF